MDNILFEFIGDHADNVDVYEETYARLQAEVEPTDTTTTVDLELGTKSNILESNEPKCPGKNPADSPLISFLPQISDHQLIESPMDTADTQMDLNKFQCHSENLSLPSLENKEETSSAQEFQPMDINTQPTDVSVSETADCEAASIPNNDQQPVVKGKKDEKKRKKAKDQIVSSKTPLPSITFLSPVRDTTPKTPKTPTTPKTPKTPKTPTPSSPLRSITLLSPISDPTITTIPKTPTSSSPVTTLPTTPTTPLSSITFLSPVKDTTPRTPIPTSSLPSITFLSPMRDTTPTSTIPKTRTPTSLLPSITFLSPRLSSLPSITFLSPMRDLTPTPTTPTKTRPSTPTTPWPSIIFLSPIKNTIPTATITPTAPTPPPLPPPYKVPKAVVRVKCIKTSSIAKVYALMLRCWGRHETPTAKIPIPQIKGKDSEAKEESNKYLSLPVRPKNRLLRRRNSKWQGRPIPLLTPFFSGAITRLEDRPVSPYRSPSLSPTATSSSSSTSSTSSTDSSNTSDSSDSSDTSNTPIVADGGNPVDAKDTQDLMEEQDVEEDEEFEDVEEAKVANRVTFSENQYIRWYVKGSKIAKDMEDAREFAASRADVHDGEFPRILNKVNSVWVGEEAQCVNKTRYAENDGAVGYPKRTKFERINGEINNIENIPDISMDVKVPDEEEDSEDGEDAAEDQDVDYEEYFKNAKFEEDSGDSADSQDSGDTADDEDEEGDEDEDDPYGLKASLASGYLFTSKETEVSEDSGLPQLTDASGSPQPADSSYAPFWRSYPSLLKQDPESTLSHSSSDEEDDSLPDLSENFSEELIERPITTNNNDGLEKSWKFPPPILSESSTDSESEERPCKLIKIYENEEAPIEGNEEMESKPKEKIICYIPAWVLKMPSAPSVKEDSDENEDCEDNFQDSEKDSEENSKEDSEKDSEENSEEDSEKDSEENSEEDSEKDSEGNSEEDSEKDSEEDYVENSEEEYIEDSAEDSAEDTGVYITENIAEKITKDILKGILDDIPYDIAKNIPEKITENITDDITDDITEDITKGITEDITKGITEDITEEITGNITEDITEDITEKITENITEDITENIPNDITENIAEDITKGITDDITDDITEDITEDITGKNVEKITEKIAEDISDDITENIPDDITENITEDITKDIKKDTTEDITGNFAEKITDDVTENIKEDITKDVIKDITENITENIAQNFPEDITENSEGNCEENCEETCEENCMENCLENCLENSLENCEEDSEKNNLPKEDIPDPKETEEKTSFPRRNRESLIRCAFDGRKYRTLKDLRERTKLSKRRIRKVLKRIGKIKRRKWRISMFYLQAYDSEELRQPRCSNTKPVELNDVFRTVIRSYQKVKFQRMEEMVKKTGLDEQQLAKALKMIGRKRSTKWRLLSYKKPLTHIHRGHKRVRD